MTDQIVIRGARTHNLKNIDCDIPHSKLTVVSGVSGSGKSSLAFDTVYAEGQRRYVESLSAYARQFLERIEKPDVDLIDGLAPAIAIKQKNSTRNPRSTVATATEIYDYMRLLCARCGTVHCIVCDGVVRRDSVDEIAAVILVLEEGTRLHAIFPVARPTPADLPDEASKPGTPAKPAPRGRTPAKRAASPAKVDPKPDPKPDPMTDALKERLTDLRRRGFNRLYQDGKIYEFSTPESILEVDFSRPVFVLVDRIVVAAENRARIVDAAEIGYRESGEILYEIVPREASEVLAARERLRFSTAFECKNCHRVYREPEPRLFSFNNPFGACPRCQGFGNTIDFDLDLIIPDKSKTLDQGAIDPWTRPKYRAYQTELKRVAKQHGIPTDVPWYDLPLEQQEFVLNGDGSGGNSFGGVHGFFELLERKKYKLHVRVMLSKYRGYATCPDCKGQRLRAEARAVRLGGKNICETAAMTIRAANQFFSELKLTPAQHEIAGSILTEVWQRLHFLDAVGLDYLTLDRLASTLSGGESQRIQLATSLGSRLVGALYVLDEPSIGLHPRDTAKLIRILEELRDLGNTILVVEHDPDVIRAADYLLDLGPGAGEFGGRLLAAGTVPEVAANPDSITGRYLNGQLKIPVPVRRREPSKEWLRLRGARIHNLKGIDCEIPLGTLVCITGVSGSGKSTLVHDVLYRAVAFELGMGDGGDPRSLYKELTGTELLNSVVLVDQAPIGRTPRSNPVTYIKAFDAIRELFAAQPEAQRRGYAAGHFSFNVPGGRCDVCDGDGTVTVEMQFLADVELPCEECNGTRYKASTLEVKYKGKNIHEVLAMTVKEALRFFAGNPRILDKLAVLDEVGLGYVRLGQSATTLSGGEAQRVKLASHLASGRAMGRTAETNGGSASKKVRSRVLYILDEPTTGLHFDDVGKLLTAFRKLIDAGGSLLVIEHNLDVIKSADWVIDLGPEGGAAGGRVVATGTPETVAKNPNSHTGQWLARVLVPKASPAEATGVTMSRSFIASSLSMFLAVWLTLSGSALAQQAPLPPGTSVPDTPAKGAQGPASPLPEAEGDISLQNYDGAQKLLLPWISAHPADARALFDLGYIEDAENHPDAAIAGYRRSIAADPRQFEARLSLGLLLARQDHPQEALEQLTTAVTLQPDPPNPIAQSQAFRALARLERTSDPAAAKQHLLQALRLGPEQPDDVLLTAEIAVANDDDATAEAAYRRVLTKQPESSAATAGLVHLLLKQKKYAEAEPLLRAALARDPDDPALNSQLASTLAYEGKQDEALAVLEKLHRLKPDDAVIGEMLADAYTQNGAPEKADPILVELLKKAPQNADLLSARGENLLQQHRYPEAITALQAALKVAPENADDWMALAIAASQAHEYPTVLEALSMRAKYAEENPGSNFLRATAYDNLHQTKQAVEYYERFLASSAGKFPDQEWEAQHRLIALGKSN